MQFGRHYCQVSNPQSYQYSQTSLKHHLFSRFLQRISIHQLQHRKYIRRTAHTLTRSLISKNKRIISYEIELNLNNRIVQLVSYCNNSYKCYRRFIDYKFSLKWNCFLHFYFGVDPVELAWSRTTVALVRVVLIDIKRVLTVQLAEHLLISLV